MYGLGLTAVWSQPGHGHIVICDRGYVAQKGILATGVTHPSVRQLHTWKQIHLYIFHVYHFGWIGLLPRSGTILPHCRPYAWRYWSMIQLYLEYAEEVGREFLEGNVQSNWMGNFPYGGICKCSTFGERMGLEEVYNPQPIHRIRFICWHHISTPHEILFKQLRGYSWGQGLIQALLQGSLGTGDMN